MLSFVNDSELTRFRSSVINNEVPLAVRKTRSNNLVTSMTPGCPSQESTQALCSPEVKIIRKTDGLRSNMDGLEVNQLCEKFVKKDNQSSSSKLLIPPEAGDKSWVQVKPKEFKFSGTRGRPLRVPITLLKQKEAPTNQLPQQQ